MAAKGSEVVTVSALGTRDRVGDLTPGAAKFTRQDAVIWPRTSTEDASRGEVVIDGLNIFLPGEMPAEVLASDIVEARGKKWAIDGVPGDYRKKGRKLGLLIVVKRLA